ncbi:MAG: hypothetical protein IJ409_01320 [Lachnospiraceae bacterium]|nr:hypothetical protein [Lachnospiraceae bacterium]
MKNVKFSGKLVAWSMALILLVFSSTSVLAAEYDITEFWSNNQKDVTGGDVIDTGSDYYTMTVYKDGAPTPEASNVREYTVPEGDYSAWSPNTTYEPYTLYLETKTTEPSEEPTPVPTEEPTSEPSEEPTPVPTEEPTPIPTMAPSGEGEGEVFIPDFMQAPATGGNHVCTYEWIVTLEPTLEVDGICSYMCAECDGVLTVQPISKYHAILKVVKEKIESAPQGATVEINYQFLESLSKDMIDLLDQRRDLTINVTFESQNTEYCFTIPAREEGNKLAEDGVEFYGLHYLGDKFGKQEIKK